MERPSPRLSPQVPPIQIDPSTIEDLELDDSPIWSPAPLNTPLFRVRSQSFPVVDDTNDEPQSPVMRALRRVSSVRFSVTTEDDDDDTTTSQPRRHFTPRGESKLPSIARHFSITSPPSTPRLSIVIQRRTERTTITIDLLMWFKLLLILSLATSVAGFAPATGGGGGARVGPTALAPALGGARVVGPAARPTARAALPWGGYGDVVEASRHAEAALGAAAALASAAATAANAPPAAAASSGLPAIASHARLALVQRCLALDHRLADAAPAAPRRLLGALSSGVCSLAFPREFGAVAGWREREAAGAEAREMTR